MKQAYKLKIIDKNTKLPSHYNRLFYVYNEKVDINGYKIVKKELYEGSQKRFIYYVPEIHLTLFLLQKELKLILIKKIMYDFFY
jgi:hypothetical protein